MRLLFLLSVVLVLVGCRKSEPATEKKADRPITPSGEEYEPEKLIAKAINAHGGKDNLAKANIAKVQGRSKGKDVDLEWEETIHFPGRLRKSLKGMFGGKRTNNLFIQNGDRAWSKDEDGDATPKTPNWEAGGVFGQIISLPTLSGQKDSQAYPIPRFDFGGRMVCGIKIDNTELYFDKKTMLMAGNKIKLPVQPKAAFVDVAYFDYKDVAGAQLPHVIEVKLNGEPFVTQHILKIELLKEIDHSLFEKPFLGVQSWNHKEYQG